MRRAVASEPLSMISNAAIGWVAYYARRWDAGISQLRSTIELDPNFMVGHLWLGNQLVQTGAFEEAVKEYEQAIRLSGRAAIAVAGLARAHAAAGRAAEAANLVAELDEVGRLRFVPQYDIVAVYAAGGNHDAAIQRVERALEAREHELVFLAVDPVMDPIRGDPRFAALAARVGI